MAKFYGEVYYGDTVEDSNEPGVWNTELTSRKYFGDVTKNYRRLENNDKVNDDIIIYTGYYQEEISDMLTYLKKYDNIIIKFGRYLTNQKSKFEPLLGVTLVSDNQYAKRIEDI